MTIDHDVVPPFALVRYRATDGKTPRPGVLKDGRVYPIDLASVGAADVNDLIARWDDLEDQLRHPTGTGIELGEVILTAPLEPRQLLHAGANYRTHVIDLAVSHRDASDTRSLEEARAAAGRMMDERAATGEPYFFVGVPRTVVGDDEPLVLPAYSDKHDWELELAAVIGRPAFRVSREDALAHVWGYTIVNDVTTRDLVFRRDMPGIGTDWYRAKNAPGFNPTGPFAVPATDLPGPDGFALRLDVNGEVMQDATSDDLLFDLPALIAGASQILPLLPGDVLLTGSPAGNGQAKGIFLRPGDEMTGSITGLGTQHVRCVADTAS